MVEEQLIRRGIKDMRVLDAMLRVPREEFIPKKLINEAYGDYPLPIGEGQTISQPYIVALMIEKLGLKGKEKVLEIGAGSGYEAAILACLCRKVYTIERIPALVKFTAENLKRLAIQQGDKGKVFEDVIVKEGDGYSGLREFSPYQGIITACAISGPPPALIEQLDEGAKLVIPLGGRFSQELTVLTKNKGSLEREVVCGCVFVPLITNKSFTKEEEGE
jgi:protein-L-isoaspartate(D-aspartate) O-methyltransferase